MSEFAPKPEIHELLPAPEKQELLPAHAERHEKHQPAAEKAGLSAAEARREIAETARPADQHNALKQLETDEQAPVSTPATVSRELKRLTLQRELRAIQTKLPFHERTLSRVIHQPAVRVVSEAAAKTLTRPSGLLGGGLVAFAGTTIYLYMAKHLGFTYNYLIFLLLFAGGFVIGLILELAVYAATASRRRTME